MTRHSMNAALSAVLALAILASETAPAVARLPAEANRSVSTVASPRDPAEVFGTLRRSPARSIPGDMSRAIALMPSLHAKIAVDPSEVRRSDVASHTMYLAPIEDGLCIFIADGSSVCSQHLEAIAKSGLALELVPPIPGRIDPVNPPEQPAVGPVTVYGVAPDGIASVEATTATGEIVTSPVADNAFVIVTDRPVVDIKMRP